MSSYSTHKIVVHIGCTPDAVAPLAADRGTAAQSAAVWTYPRCHSHHIYNAVAVPAGHTSVAAAAAATWPAVVVVASAAVAVAAASVGTADTAAVASAAVAASPVRTAAVAADCTWPAGSCSVGSSV